MTLVITAGQLVAHAIGDYVLQSDWMAMEKTKRDFPAFAHALFYTLPFLFLTTSWRAIAFILATHFIIDRHRLARYVVWAKNFLAPSWTVKLEQTPNTPEASSPGGFVNQYVKVVWWHPWSECEATGYHKDRPAWMTVWLMIIADNIMHIMCNAFALTYFVGG